MSFGHPPITDSELLDCKQKLFTEPASGASHPIYQQQFSAGLQSAIKSILKSDVSPRKTKKITLKSTQIKPNNNFSTYQKRSTLVDLRHTKRKYQNSSFQSQICDNFNVSWKITPTNPEIDLMPTPKRYPNSIGSLHHESMLRQSRRSNETNKFSKSKRKIQFTIFQEKRKSLSNFKQYKTSPNKQINFPYPYHKDQIIDLFNTKVDNDQKSKSKSKMKSRKSPERSILSLKQSNVHKNLRKSRYEIINDEVIQSHYLKLLRFKFVFNYLDRFQIIELFNRFKLQGQPSCKWVLLIIDQAFKKMKYLEENH